MFFYNIIDKVYISKFVNIIADDTKKIIIGEDLSKMLYDDNYNVIFSSRSLEELLANFNDTSFRDIFNKHDKLIIYASDEEFPKLYMHFVMHLQEAYELSDEECSVILLKTCERFFSESFDSTIDMDIFSYLKLKSSCKVGDNIFLNKKLSSLPLEIMYFLHYKGKVKNNDITEKIYNFSSNMLKSFFKSVLRIGFPLIASNPKVLELYCERECPSVIETIHNDKFLSSLFSGSNSKEFFNANKKEIGKLTRLIHEKSISYDRVSEGDTIFKEFNRINRLLENDGCIDFFNYDSKNFFGELVALEYKDNINIILIKYIVNIQKERRL